MAPSDSRSPEQIEADLAAVRNRLSGSIQGLIDQVYPTRVKQRFIAQLRAGLQSRVDEAKALVIEPNGQLRTDRVALAGGAVAGLIAFVAVVRSIGRRARRSRPAVGVRTRR